MFLKNIKINNFRSIQKASVDFENGLNILIGKNGVGKSNLLKYIDQNVQTQNLSLKIRDARNLHMEFEFTLSSIFQNTTKVELSLYFKKERIKGNDGFEVQNIIKWSRYENNTVIAKDRELIIKSSDEFDTVQWKELKKNLSSFSYISKSYLTFEIPLQNEWLTSSTKFGIDRELNFIINTEWSSFTFLSKLEQDIQFIFTDTFLFNEEQYNIETLDISFIETLITKKFVDLKKFTQIEKHLPKITSIEELRLNTNLNSYLLEGRLVIENLFLEFKINGSWMPWSYLSDGTKRLFYLISECLSLREGGILLIEEPELGIHPQQLFSLIDFLNEQSETKQIIISTHSPIVLDVLSPYELKRITIVKLGDKGTEFHKLNDEQIEKAQRYMEEVGELSYYWLHSDLEDEE